MERVIAIIDLKSFYASCECSARHLDPFSTPLVCADASRGESTIVMSTSPYLKIHYGVPNVCRKKDLPKIKGMIYATPRMSFYLKMSARVISIFLDFVAKEDLHIYSVDECFMNLGPYLSLYQKTAEDMVKEIQKRIYDELGLIATAGIGPNMFLAKLALDNEGKKQSPYLARWDFQDVPAKLWKMETITDIWGIGKRTAAHLQRIGIHNVKQLAHTPLPLLEEEFGVMGDQLHSLANGIDDSDIQKEYTPKEKSISVGQTLMRDYSKFEGKLLIKEMCDDLVYRLRKTRLLATKIALFIGYSKGNGTFSKEQSLVFPSDDSEEICVSFLSLYERYVSNFPLRNISLSLGKLCNPHYEQSSFFVDEEKESERRSLYRSIDAIKELFGKNSLLRCSSLRSYSTARTRHVQIGGHKE